MHGPTYQVHTPLRSSDGQNLLSDNTSIHAGWPEHFQSLFTANHNVQDTAIHRIPQLPLKQELYEPPTRQETIMAIAHLQCHKAAGADNITPEIWKFGSPMLHVKLYDLLVCYSKQSKYQQDFRDAVIIALYKNKGEQSNCSNYRGITLLSIAGKVLPETCSTGVYQQSQKNTSP